MNNSNCRSLKKILSFVFVICITVFVTSSFTAAPRPKYKLSKESLSKLDFDLVNKTGYAISEIYVSPTKEQEWGEDIMGKDILEDGQTVSISFDREETASKWDIYVTWDGYDSDEDVYWIGFDLKKIEQITLYYDAKTGKTWAETR